MHTKTAALNRCWEKRWQLINIRIQAPGRDSQHSGCCFSLICCEFGANESKKSKRAENNCLLRLTISSCRLNLSFRASACSVCATDAAHIVSWKTALRFPRSLSISLQTHSPSLFAMTIKNTEIRKNVSIRLKIGSAWESCPADPFLIPLELLIHLSRCTPPPPPLVDLYSNRFGKTAREYQHAPLYISSASQQANQMCNYFHKYFHATIIRRLLIASWHSRRIRSAFLLPASPRCTDGHGLQVCT